VNVCVEFFLEPVFSAEIHPKLELCWCHEIKIRAFFECRGGKVECCGVLRNRRVGEAMKQRASIFAERERER
jgi:hypothetical protein